MNFFQTCCLLPAVIWLGIGLLTWLSVNPTQREHDRVVTGKSESLLFELFRFFFYVFSGPFNVMDARSEVAEKRQKIDLKLTEQYQKSRAEDRISREQANAEKFIQNAVAGGAVVVKRGGTCRLDLYGEEHIDLGAENNPEISASFMVSETHKTLTEFWLRLKAIEKRSGNHYLFQVSLESVKPKVSLDTGGIMGKRYFFYEDSENGILTFELVKGTIKLGQDYFLKFKGHVRDSDHKYVSNQVMMPHDSWAVHHRAMLKTFARSSEDDTKMAGFLDYLVQDQETFSGIAKWTSNGQPNVAHTRSIVS